MEKEIKAILDKLPELPEVYVRMINDWKLVYECALNTQGKQVIDKEPTDQWKLRQLYAEHSMIRELRFKVDMIGLRKWVAMHIVRHGVFTGNYISTGRSDRVELPLPRDAMPQGTPTDHFKTVNAQALIDEMRSRLCTGKVSKETYLVERLVVEKIRELDPQMASVLVPNCVYRGFCPETKTCNYDESTNYLAERESYVLTCRELQGRGYES